MQGGGSQARATTLSSLVGGAVLIRGLAVTVGLLVVQRADLSEPIRSGRPSASPPGRSTSGTATRPPPRTRVGHAHRLPLPAGGGLPLASLLGPLPAHPWFLEPGPLLEAAEPPRSCRPGALPRRPRPSIWYLRVSVQSCTVIFYHKIRFCKPTRTRSLFSDSNNNFAVNRAFLFSPKSIGNLI